MKRFFALLLVILLLCGCTQTPRQTQPTESKSNTVGVCLPNFNWYGQAQKLTQLLEAQGRQVLVEYAGDDVQRQSEQIQTFVNMPVGGIVLVAIDGMRLADALENARQENVPVVAFDRLPTYTQGVTGCVAADSYAAGQAMGKFIVESSQLDTAEKPVSVEFFMDNPESYSSILLYQGVMDTLQPYLSSGVLYCPSGRISFEDVCIPDGTGDTASERLFDQLAETGKTPQVLCAASDTLAAGCIDALASFGMNPEEEGWPLVTGMGATADALEYIDMGYQSMTFSVDSDALLQQCAQWTVKAMEDESLTGTMQDNGVMEVPCFLQEPTLVDARNYKDYITE